MLTKLFFNETTQTTKKIVVRRLILFPRTALVLVLALAERRQTVEALPAWDYHLRSLDS
jgi:hypothetical protein